MESTFTCARFQKKIHCFYRNEMNEQFSILMYDTISLIWCEKHTTNIGMAFKTVSSWNGIKTLHQWITIRRNNFHSRYSTFNSIRLHYKRNKQSRPQIMNKNDLFFPFPQKSLFVSCVISSFQIIIFYEFTLSVCCHFCNKNKLFLSLLFYTFSTQRWWSFQFESFFILCKFRSELAHLLIVIGSG